MNKIAFLVALVFFFGCTQEDTVDQILAKSIEAHGADVFEAKKVSFNFRDKTYSVERGAGEYVYTRSFDDSAGWVHDRLVNSSVFTRTVDEFNVELNEEWRQRYGRSVNSVLYFFQLPLVLNDPAAIKEKIGVATINGEDYDAIKVSFQQEGGGEDFEDEFRYWIHKKTGLMDFLAYNYITDGGGTRFRQAINRRDVDGLIVQDYINFKPDEKYPPLDTLPALMEAGALTELSRIINTDVRIE